jgi:hypothetical protein
MFCKLGIISIVGVLKRDTDRHAKRCEVSARLGVGTGGNRAELGGGGEQRASLCRVHAFDRSEVGECLTWRREIDRLTAEQLLYTGTLCEHGNCIAGERPELGERTERGGE